MESFRCYFLDNHDHILFPANIVAEDLEAAKRRALVLMHEPREKYSSMPTAIEIWQGAARLFPSPTRAEAQLKIGGWRGLGRALIERSRCLERQDR
jgi:hypothetical protein